MPKYLGDALLPEDGVKPPESVLPAPPCVHEYVYGGVKYKVSHVRAESSPHGWIAAVFYYDWYYCQKCTKPKYVELNVPADPRDYALDTTKFNATPMSIGETGRSDV